MKKHNTIRKNYKLRKTRKTKTRKTTISKKRVRNTNKVGGMFGNMADFSTYVPDPNTSAYENCIIDPLLGIHRCRRKTKKFLGIGKFGFKHRNIEDYHYDKLKCDYINNNLKRIIDDIKLYGTIDEKNQIDKIIKTCKKTNKYVNYTKERLMSYIDGTIPTRRKMSYIDYMEANPDLNLQLNQEKEKKEKKEKKEEDESLMSMTINEEEEEQKSDAKADEAIRFSF